MHISSYDLLGNSYGRGYKDNPYVMEDLYVRGDSTVEWEVVGTGRFGLNLSDMTNQLFEEGIHYTIISVFVNGVLVKTSNDILTSAKDFGVVLDLTDNTSTIELQFNGFDNSLLYINKITSFIYKDSPELETSGATTTTVEPVDLSDEDAIKSAGIRIADVDLSSVCGPYRLTLSPDTGEFHLLNNEVWFTGERETERGYSVTVKAYDNNDQVIETEVFDFSVLKCHSSSPCAGGGTGGGEDDESVDDEIPAPSNISISTGECGVKEGQSEDDESLWIEVNIDWSGEPDERFDVQISRGNSFSIITLEYESMTGTTLSVLLEINTTYFFRARRRSDTSNEYSEWSEVIQFFTNASECTSTLPIPEPPTTLPIPCDPGIPPSGPVEPPVDPPKPESPNPPTDPPNPTDPDGPDACFGSGCGDNDPDPENPTPGLPCCYTPPGCVGPGCGPDSNPLPPGSPPGTPPGNPGGPGGPDDKAPPEEFPPEIPPPIVPVCADDSVHKTILRVENTDDTGTVVVEIRWDKEQNPSCLDYFDGVGVKDLADVVPSVSVSPEETVDIDLGFACPECLNVCIIGQNSEEVNYVVLTQAYNDQGQAEEPYASEESTQIAQPSCSCENLSISNVWPLKDEILQDGSRERTRLSIVPIMVDDSLAPLRALDPGNEECFQFKYDKITNDVYQIKSKLACYACTDRGFKEITSEIIGCETVLSNTFGDPNVANRQVSHPNHWEMGNFSFTYAENVWPSTDFIDWEWNVFPFKSVWELEAPLCVTCCDTEDRGPPLNQTRQLGAVQGDNGVSTSNSTHNSMSCQGGSVEIDQNLNGHTSPSTLVPQCYDVVLSYQYLDTYGVASNLGYTRTQAGYSEITLAEADAITAALSGATCETNVSEPSVCVEPGGIGKKNYSYLINTAYQTRYCNGTDDENTVQEYRIFQGYTNNPAAFTLYNTETGAINCDGASFGNGVTQSCMFNALGTFTLPIGDSCFGQVPPFPVDGGDGLPYDKSRYGITMTGEAHAVGGGSNPLP